VNAGLARARAKGTRLGRRRVKPAIEARIHELKAEGMGILKIGRTVGVGTSVVQRVLPVRVATVAMANKTARIVWAIMASGETYRAAHRPAKAL
jgi:DNA invertase Pin-like site-specific DNA recombinase